MTNDLTYIEREVLKLRLGIGYESTYTKSEIARIFKKRFSQIKEIEARAVRKLLDDEIKSLGSALIEKLR